MAVTNLHTIRRDMIQYGTTLYFTLGLLGNICNCIIFTRPSRRRSPSSIYFLSLSIFSVIYLIWSITPLLYSLYHADPQTQSLLYCKLRLYGIHVFGQCIRTAVVFACADRFFATHRDVRFRSLSSVPVAMKLTFLTVLGWSVLSMHLPLLMTLSSGVCHMVGTYKLIYAIYQTVLVGILPPMLMIIFSVGTVRGLHQQRDTRTRVRSRDRYLMRMVVAEVLVNVTTSIPFSLNVIYGAITYNVAGKSARRQEIEAFLSFAAHFVVYLISVAPFYLFMITSKPFRAKFIKLLVQCWNKYLRRRAQNALSHQFTTARAALTGVLRRK